MLEKKPILVCRKFYGLYRTMLSSILKHLTGVKEKIKFLMMVLESVAEEQPSKPNIAFLVRV